MLSIIELASNHLLGFDAATAEKLQKLQGKTVELEIKNFNRSFFLTPQKEGLDLVSTSDKPADVCIKTTLRALVKIGAEGIENAELEAGELEIIGDALVGQRFASLISQINIDWEEVLAEQFGDTPAFYISTAASQAGSFFKENIKPLLGDDADIGDKISQLSETVESFVSKIKKSTT